MRIEAKRSLYGLLVGLLLSVAAIDARGELISCEHCPITGVTVESVVQGNNFGFGPERLLTDIPQMTL